MATETIAVIGYAVIGVVATFAIYVVGYAIGYRHAKRFAAAMALIEVDAAGINNALAVERVARHHGPGLSARVIGRIYGRPAAWVQAGLDANADLDEYDRIGPALGHGPRNFTPANMGGP